MSELYEKIDELCRKKGVSGAKMAAELGLSRSSLSELRSGRSQSFRMETMRKIAQYFDVTLDELLGEPGAPPANASHQLATFLKKVNAQGMDIAQFDDDELDDIVDFMKLLKRKKER